MNYLAYTPSCEAYIETTDPNGVKKYYDVSKDITSMTITRLVNDASHFEITLANKNRKYNGLFTPMDRIALFANKTERYQMLTGYITSVTVFTLYSGDFKIKGKCSIYNLQQKFWDKSLKAVQDEFGGLLTSQDAGWIGTVSLAQRLVINVGGWDAGSVKIGAMPQSVSNWASELYAAQKGDLEQGVTIVREFEKMLHNQTSAIGAGSNDFTTIGGDRSQLAYTGPTNLKGNKAQKAVCSLYVSWEGAFSYSQAAGREDPVRTGYGDCSSTIYAAYLAVTGMNIGGWTGEMLGNGILIAEGSGPMPIDRCEPGDILLVNHTAYNPTYDHVELYLGNNELSGHGGPGNGPYRKPDAVAYSASRHDWMIRRYLGSGVK